jgi:hypothetical protein
MFNWRVPVKRRDSGTSVASDLAWSYRKFMITVVTIPLTFLSGALIPTTGSRLISVIELKQGQFPEHQGCPAVISAVKSGS